MHLFNDYLQHLTLWLYIHPNWALLIAFLMSFAESLAIIGSIVPGSVTMTAIGILAGSGVMDIGLTLLAAASGAVAGDAASYALGYTFSERLTEVWPFRRYPHWLDYGQDYFAKHGGKSVIIGRFFGPLRSIIPVIAGILRMNGWHFLLANIISGIGWAILYVMPGVLIGEASNELSSESATRLFIFTLILLVTAWLFTQAMKWLFLHANNLLHTQLLKIWSWSRKHPRIAALLKNLTPRHEKNYFQTISLTLLFLICLFISIAITLLVVQGTYVELVNKPCLLFLQSLRTESFDIFFILMSQIISPVPLTVLVLTVSCYTIYFKSWHMLRYWVSLCITGWSVTWLLSHLVNTPNPDGLLYHQSIMQFPAINLTLATSLLCFLVSVVHTYFQAITMLTMRIALSTLLCMLGLSLLYLGDNWLSSVLAAYFIGLTLCIAHWIYFRRKQHYAASERLRAQVLVALSCAMLLMSSGIVGLFNYKKIAREHSSYLKQYVLTHNAWWEQKKPFLPLYTKNRIGNPTGLFNVQYLGSLSSIKQSMVNHGWKQQTNSFFYSLLMRASGQNSAQELPLMAQLYLNRKPSLIMTYALKSGKTSYILRLWRSNYHLENHPQPIWFGNLVYIKNKKSTEKQKLFANLLPALNDFKFRRISLPQNNRIKSLPREINPNLLLIEEE